MDHIYLLSLIVFLPALGALVLLLIPRDLVEAIRWFTLGVTGVVFGLTVGVFFFGETSKFDKSASHMQDVFNWSWIPSFDIYYYMGVDGISLAIVVLTAFVSLLAMGASWTITKQVKAYCILFLLLETGMLGVFLSLDFFLFYVFWEVMLLPMYFLIGVWGGPRREYAAIKFFIYTLFGSVLMLIAILILYFNSDLRELAAQSDLYGNESAAVSWDKLHVHQDVTDQLKADQLKAEQGDAAAEQLPPIHTFNLLALAAIGQHTTCFSQSMQSWAFVLLFIGFAIKVPSVPVHTWLPDAHVEGPTPISMILAGVLLKMGGYGIIRICYPICPHGGYDWATWVCAIGVISMVYGAFAALAQKDFKRMVAYSSVSHMGYVVLGLGVWSATKPFYNSDYWNMGVQGAMFQMIAHGVSSAGMFFIVGVVYDRVHHRNLDEFGGLFAKMPTYTAFAIVLFFAGLGLPGLCGFIGEVLVVLSIWEYSIPLAVIAASVVILTAAYILWALQRIFLGAEYKGPHEEALTPMTLREKSIAFTLCTFAVVLGMFPYQTVLDYMDETVDRQVTELTEWTKNVKEADRFDEAEEAPPEPPVREAAAVPDRNAEPRFADEKVTRAIAVETQSVAALKPAAEASP